MSIGGHKGCIILNMDEGGLPTCTRLDTFYFFKSPGDVHDGPEDKITEMITLSMSAWIIENHDCKQIYAVC